MSLRRLSPVVAVLAALTAAATATPLAHADETLTSVSMPTEVRASAGLAVLSVFDAGTRTYRLATLRGPGPPVLLPVAPRPVPFDADAGPDSRGRPAIVYSRCAVEATRFGAPTRDCDLYRYSLFSRKEARIRNSDSDDASEVSPTIWKGTIAWSRTLDGRAGAQPVVYTRPLTAPRGRRSKRLPGVPTRRCSPLPDEGCGPTSAIEAPSLELYGRWLAEIVRYDYRGAGGLCGRWEVRLATLAGGARQVAAQTCGLNGQNYVGVSFAEGRLYFARYCAADPRGCGRGPYGAFRYRLSDATYSLARFGRRLTGFAIAAGQRAYEVRADDTQDGYCGNSLPGETPPCTVVLTDPLAFARADAPR